MALGETAVFQCSHLFADNIGWRVDGVSLARSLPGAIAIGGTLPTGGITQSLLIGNVSTDNNGSAIECVAIFFDGREPQITSAVFLYVQGKYSCMHG